MCVFWLISAYNTQNLLRQQAERLGQTLAQQTATQLTELVLANDLISMNVVLSGITRNSTIAEVAVLNIDREIVAAAAGTQAPVETIIPLPVKLNALEGVYLAPILLTDSVAGYIRLRLDLSYIEVGLVNNFLFVIAATLILIAVAATLTTTYFQYLISFPINLLAFSISNIRKGNGQSGEIRVKYKTLDQIFKDSLDRSIKKTAKDIRYKQGVIKRYQEVLSLMTAKTPPRKVFWNYDSIKAICNIEFADRKTIEGDKVVVKQIPYLRPYTTISHNMTKDQTRIIRIYFQHQSQSIEILQKSIRLIELYQGEHLDKEEVQYQLKKMTEDLWIKI